jgi:biopolymer transport protein ExbD
MRGLLGDYSSKLTDRRNPSLTPLMDVAFQLILFFLVTSSFTSYSAMKVKLPEASSAQIDTLTGTITLEISREESAGQSQPEKLIVRWWEKDIRGEIFWPPREGEDPAAGLSMLKMKLEEYKSTLEEGTTPSVVVAGDGSVPYQVVITVIDMCEQLKLDIVLAIQRRAASP